MRRVRRAEVAGLTCVLVQPVTAADGQKVVARSHSGAEMSAQVAANLEDLAAVAGGFSVVAVDDVHLFSNDAGRALDGLARKGHLVIAAGLDRDSSAKPFPPMPHLLALADRVDKLHAVCHQCGADAFFTQRLALAEGRSKLEKDPRVYEARCRSCFEVPS